MAQPSPPRQDSSAVGECLRTAAKPPDSSALELAAFQRGVKDWVAVCDKAVAENGDNPQIKTSFGRALAANGQRLEAVPLFRAAASHDDAEAMYELYEHHKSWDRGDVIRVQAVMRAEADRSLRRAAELGHPVASKILATLLDRGGTVKRDAVAARVWAERALAIPIDDASRGDLQILLGRLLANSSDSGERACGVALLETLAQQGRFGATTALANAIREENPARARALLEQAARPDPGGAIPKLADMLIKGEGGPADPRRALMLLGGRSDISAAKGVLGQLYLKGRFVPRDVQEAVCLIDIAGQWDFDARQQILRLLAANPNVHIAYPARALFDATEAAELDEPGAVDALIGLKLSQNAQFRDKPGACILAEMAAKRGDRKAAQYLSECRAS